MSTGETGVSNIAEAIVAVWKSAGARVAARSADSDRAISGAELVDEVLRISRALRQAGVSMGERVALCSGNDPRFVTAYYGILHAGAVVVPFNTRVPGALLTELIKRSGAVGAIVVARPSSEGAEAIVEAALDAVPGFVWCDGIEQLPGAARVQSLDDVLASTVNEGASVGAATGLNSEALLLGTSGTTGPGKGVRLSHGNLFAAAGSFGKRVALNEKTNAFIAFPLASSFGQSALLTGSLLRGGMVTLHEPYRPATVYGALLQGEVTHFVGVPTMYAALAHYIRQQGGQSSEARERLGALWYGVGGAPVPRSIVEIFDEEFGWNLRQGYGLTETGSISTFNSHARSTKPESAGPPLEGCTIEVIDANGNAVPQGHHGEIVITGPNVMIGYVGDAPIEGQRLRTGDIGYLDEDGHVVVVDRIKDLIIRGGENLFPRFIESVIAKIDGVIQAAVVGKADEYYGEVPVAFVAVSDTSLTASAIRERLAAELPASAVPVEVHFVAELPLGATGKILKRELRQLLAGA